MPAVPPGGQHGHGPGDPAGSFPVADMDLPGYVCLVRDAARASALSWAEPMDQCERDRAARHLSITLRHLQIVIARLAGRLRLGAIAQPGSALTTRAAAIAISTLDLAQAWLILEDILPAQDAPAYDACVPADLLCHAARRAVTWQMPATGLDEITRYLADALEALDEGTARLAASATQPLAGCLTAVRTCLQEAGKQLRTGPPSADPAVPPSAGVSCSTR